jgi:hypothetical protein
MMCDNNTFIEEREPVFFPLSLLEWLAEKLTLSSLG